MMTPFECDICIFRKLKHASPVPDLQQDKLLLILIRRMNLDAFWSRARSTVMENTRRVKQTLGFSKSVGLDGPYEHEGPYPYYDHCGYEVAVDTLMHSMRPGRHSKTHTQVETIRKLRTSFSSQVRASPQANMNHLSLLDQKGRYLRFATDKCGSLWFDRFMAGLKNRMGSIWVPNKGLSVELLLRVIQKAEERMSGEVEPETKYQWVIFVTYIVLTYVLSLRGNEGFMLDMEGLRKHWDVDRKDYVTIVLVGKLKGDSGYKEYLIPCTNQTKSGINVRYTLARLLEVKEKLGQISGPAISDMEGFLLASQDINLLFHELLFEIFETNRSYFPPSVSSLEEITENYRCNRSLRRTSDTRALEEKVSRTDIEIVNKWEQKGNRKKVAGQAMTYHYAQFELLLKPFLRYTHAM